MNSLFDAYSPGSSPVHKTPLWSKWLCTLGIAFACTFTSSWVIPLICCGLIITIGCLAGITIKNWLVSAWSIKWLLLAMSVYYIFFNKIEQGADVLLTLLTLIFTSKVLLFSTPTPVLIDGFVKFCRPLQIFGVSPRQVGLAIALMLRSIPVIMDLWVQLQVSVKARGLKVSPFMLFTPLMISTVNFAHETGDAIAARGLDRPDTK